MDDDELQTLDRDERGVIRGGTLASDEAARRGRLGAEARNAMNEGKIKAKADEYLIELFGYEDPAQANPGDRDLCDLAARKPNSENMRLMFRQSRRLVSEKQSEKPEPEQGPRIVLSDEAAASIAELLKARNEKMAEELAEFRARYGSL